MAKYASEYRLLPLVYLNKLDWEFLSGNPNAIHLMEKKKNLDKIDWGLLSGNPNAIHLLEKKENYDKI